MRPLVAHPISCVLFDLYGTLLDIELNEDAPALWEGLASALRRAGGAVRTAHGVRTRFRRILREEGARRQEGFVMEPTFARLVASYGAVADVSSLGRIFRQLSTVSLTMRPYAAPLFTKLGRRQCRIGIVSNTEAVLTRLDLDRFPRLLSADAILLSSDVGVRKPDPRIFHMALDRLDAEPARTVVIGNSLDDDVEGARRAGLRAIYLDEEAHDIEPLHRDGSVLRVRPSYETVSRALERLEEG